MEVERVTIRAVNSDTIQEVREVAKYNDLTLGEATNEAFSYWLASLEEDLDG